MTDRKKAVVIALTMIMNGAGALMAQHVFASGSVALGICAVVGGLCANLLAFFGVPIVKSSPAMQLPKDNKGSIRIGVMAVLGIAGMGLALALAGGCATVKHAGIDFGSCALGKAPSTVTALLGDVEQALAGPEVNWQDSLTQIGIKSGVDLLECAVLTVESMLKAQLPMHGQPDAALVVKIARAESYLKAHPVKK